MPSQHRSFMERIIKRVNERNVVIFIILLFIATSIWVLTVPYDPMKWDLADATTNVIWTRYYSEGRTHIPYEEWNHPPTQSVVVEHDGEYVVVNEKGPGHVILILPFFLLHIERLFGPWMLGVAVLSTYMLGRRLANWRVGAIASILVMTNLTVIIMCHRFWWTDASTMHMLILSMWLIVEANYQLNKHRKDQPVCDKTEKVGGRQALFGLGLAIAAGAALGASISTRYPVALTVIAPISFLIIYYVKSSWPQLRKRKLLRAIKNSKYLFLILICFIIGLLLIIIPLMQYNQEYFGGPFKSGYDATMVNQFRPDTGLEPRNQSTGWANSIDDGLGNVFDNFFELIPVFLTRMPCMLFIPFGIFVLRRDPILVMLLLWIIIIFVTYLSISWVGMYVERITAVHEPRYFMPALPAIALLAGVAIEKIANNESNKRSAHVDYVGRGNHASRAGHIGHISHIGRTGEQNAMNITRVMFVILIVFSLVFVGIVPAENHFQKIRAGDYSSIRPRGPPGNNQPIDQPILVKTDQLIKEPERFVDRFVVIKKANITRLEQQGELLWVRSQDALVPESMEVRLRDWPGEELAKFKVGQTVDVSGFFRKANTVDLGPRYFIIVKYGTNDLIQIVL